MHRISLVNFCDLVFSWRKSKFLFALLLGLGFSQIVFAQNKKADSSSINLRTSRVDDIGMVYCLDAQKITARSNQDTYSWFPPSNLFLNQEYNAIIGWNRELNTPKDNVFTGFKPIMHNETSRYSKYDFSKDIDTSDYIIYPNCWKHSLLYRKVYQENLFIIRDSASKFYATIDPLFNFQASMDHTDSDKKYTQNTRGILIQGNVGSKFAFASIFWENQASLPYYLRQYVNDNYVIPGNGRPKGFGINSYDFSTSEAYLTYAFSQHFSIQGGYGKNFIGDGYRSLLLSDNSFVYPYLRFTTTFWHIQYTNLYTEFQDPFTSYATTVGNVENLIQRKAGAFQYLSWNIVPQVEFGLFQGLIWTAGDQYNHMAFNFNYFDPIIGVNAATYGLGNTNNVLLGSTINYKICKHVMTYGQLLVDDFPQNGNIHSFYNRTGYQLGAKYYNKYGEVQVEYNQVRPYTYSSSDSLQNYSHYDQSLADPLGANFKEFIAIVNLRYHHFSIHLQGNHAMEGLDSTKTNYGNNMFLPDSKPTLPSTNVQMLQGVKSTLNYIDFHISYLMNPRTNMNFTIGISRRTLTNSLNNQPNMTLIYVGFRTSIENFYTDF